MAEPSFAEQMATELDPRGNRGAPGPRAGAGRGLEDFKSALDDMRLRLWGLLSAAGGSDSRGFQELFRIRRATEMCRALGDDLHSGSISGRHRELAGLGQAATELAEKIEQARRDAY